MVEPLLHLAIPLALFRISGLDRRTAILGGLVALMPDLDVLLMVHRSMTHSAFLLALVAVPAYLAAQRFGRERLVAVLAAAWASHIFLDLFTGYTPILWPILGWDLWLNWGLTVKVASSPHLLLDTIVLSRATSFTPLTGFDAPLFTSSGLGISLLLSAFALAPWRRR